MFDKGPDAAEWEQKFDALRKIEEAGLDKHNFYRAVCQRSRYRKKQTEHEREGRINAEE